MSASRTWNPLTVSLVLMLSGTQAALLSAAEPQAIRYPGVITGRVLDREGGTGLAGIDIQAANSISGIRVHSTSGADGAWRIENVPSGSYILRMNPGAGRASDGVEVRVLRNEVRAADLWRDSRQWISGTVREHGTGRPVAGVSIHFTNSSDRWESVESDASGRFRADLGPGQLSLTGMPPLTWSLCDDQGQPLAREQFRPCLLRAGVPVENFDWTVILNPRFRGRVSLPDGSPASNVNVHVEAWFTPVSAERRQQLKLMNSGTARFIRGVDIRHEYEGGEAWPRGNDIKSRTDADGMYSEALAIARSRPDVVPSILNVFAANEEFSLVGVAAPDSIDVKLGLPGSVKFKLPENIREFPPADRLWITDPRAHFREYHGHAGRHLGDGVYQYDKLIPGLWYAVRTQVPDGQEFSPFQVNAGEVLDLGVLARDEPPRRTPQELLELLAAESQAQQLSALNELRRLGPEAAFAVPALIAELDDPNSPNKGGEAAEILGKIGPAASAAVPKLMDIVIANEVGRDLTWPLGALGAIGDRRAIPVLKRALTIREMSVHVQTLQAMSQFPAEDVVPSLTFALSIPHLRGATVCRTLGEYGPAAREAVPALVDLLWDARSDQRSAIVEALGKIGDSAALPALKELAGTEPDSQEFSRFAKAIDDIHAHLEQDAPSEK